MGALRRRLSPPSDHPRQDHDRLPASPSRKPAFDALALRHASIEVRHAPTTLVPERFEVRCLDDEDQVVAIRRLDGGGRNV